MDDTVLKDSDLLSITDPMELHGVLDMRPLVRRLGDLVVGSGVQLEHFVRQAVHTILDRPRSQLANVEVFG